MISTSAANDIMDHDRQNEGKRSRTCLVSASSPLMNSSRRCPAQPTSHHCPHPSPSNGPNGPNRPSKQVRHLLRPRPHHKLSLFLIICVFALNCSAHLISLSGPVDEQMIEEADDVPAQTPREKLLPLDDDLLGSALARLAKTGTILVDPRPPPKVPESTWDFEDVNDAIALRMRMRRREEKRADSSSATATATSQSTSTVASTSASSTILVAATSTSTSLPTPFDSGFSNNITQSCTNFLNGFLSNATFKECLPISLLLQSSNSFFQVEKSLVRTTQLLDYTCSANVTTCAAYTSELAANLTIAANCASDLSKQNPMVVQALLGLESYQTLYQATCLRNPSTASYCFADAVTNSSSPTDVYPYYLPLNVTLPGGSQPTCNTCLKDTMAVFQSASSNRSSPIAGTYAAAAQIINVNCGPSFVNTSLAATTGTTSSATSASSSISNLSLYALVFLVCSWLL